MSDSIKETIVNPEVTKISEQKGLIDLTKIKGIESENIDLGKYHKKNSKIETAEVIQVNSKFTPLIENSLEHQKQWVLKLSSGVVETIGDGEEKVDFRASELFNLIQDENGNLKGFPTGEQSNLLKFCKDIKINLSEIENLSELLEKFKGKEVTIKAYDKEVVIDGERKKRTYLKFLY
jgi:hypothetical protein